MGLAASTFVAVSLDPPLVSICIRSESTTWPVLRRCPRLGISVLAEDHQDAARALAGTARDRFTGLDLDPRDDGALFVQGSPLSLSATVVEDFLAGDHKLVLCRVNEVRVRGDIDPLVFHRSRMRRLTPE